MKIAIYYFLAFLFVWLRYRKKAKKSIGALLLVFYVLSALLSLIIEFTPSFVKSAELDFLSISYYLLCMLISLLPYLYLGKKDSDNFQIPYNLLKNVSIFLIILGLIELFSSFVFIFSNLNAFLYNIVSIRDGFYETLGDVSQTSIFEKILIFVRPLQFMLPFCCLYFISMGNKKLAIWSAIASMCVPVHGMTIGERESILVFFSNYAFSYLFFRPKLKEDLKQRLKKTGLIAMIPFALFFASMSSGRFGEKEGGVFGSFLAYGGKQPYFFSYLFNNPHIDAQKLGGRFCFQYLFPSNERAWKQLNEYISADIYLNQFGGMPGSLFLDFGYYSILIVILFSLAYYLMIKRCKKIDGKYPFYILFLFYFSYQVLFMNIFFLRHIYTELVFLPFVFFLFCWLYPKMVGK